MWICAASGLTRVFVGVVDFVNNSLFWSGFNFIKTAICNFKYIKSLYIIDIKSGPDCQFDSSKYFHKYMKIFNYFASSMMFSGLRINRYLDRIYRTSWIFFFFGRYLDESAQTPIASGEREHNT